MDTYRIRLLKENPGKIDDVIDEWMVTVNEDDQAYNFDEHGFMIFETDDGREIGIRPGNRHTIQWERKLK